jgi:hypothetical protein
LTKEALGHIVGTSLNLGHTLTWKILTSDTQHIIDRSLVCPASPEDAIICAGMFYGEENDQNVWISDTVIKSDRDFTIVADS